MKFHCICDALPQNREQVTFWVKWDFGTVVRSKLSALINIKIKFILHLLFEIWPFVYETLKVVYLKVWLEKFAVSYGFDRLQKMQNFCEKMLKFSQKLHANDRKQIKVCKTNTKISESTDWSFFTPMQTLIARISKWAWHVWLVPCFVGVHHEYEVVYQNVL